MHYKPFGRTGVNVSPLVLGCMMFGQKTELDETKRIVDHALDAGINFLDTANVYGGGRSEEFTGEALSSDGKRDRVFLATKVHQRMSPDPNGLGNTRLHMIEQCEASLRRLKTDHIDLYQIHRPDPHIAIDETLRAFDDLVKSGKVRYFGTSNFGAWQVVEALWASKELGLNRFVSEQSPFSLADRRAEREQIPMARTFSLAFIPWSPLGGGGLTGKYRKGQPLPSGTRFGDETDPEKQKRFSEDVADIVEVIAPLSEAKGCTIAQYSLAWVMAQPGVTAPIVGPRTLKQFEDNLGAIDVELGPEDFAAMDAAIAPGEYAADFFEASFAPNQHRIW